MAEVASDMGVEIEPLMVHEFIPVPQDAEKRHRLVATYGKLEVYAFDLYSTALSKVARGFESDLDDVMFLLSRKLIDLKDLENHVNTAIPNSGEFDIDPNEFRRNWKTLRTMLRH